MHILVTSLFLHSHSAWRYFFSNIFLLAMLSLDDTVFLFFSLLCISFRNTHNVDFNIYIFYVTYVLQIVAVFAIGLAVDPMNSFQRIFNRSRFKLDDAATIYITIAGYILINTLFVISHLLGDRIPKRTVIIKSH